MAEGNGSGRAGLAQAILLDDPEFLRGIVERALQAVLEEEMTAHLGAARYERAEVRTGYRNGHKPRTLTTREIGRASCRERVEGGARRAGAEEIESAEA